MQQFCPFEYSEEPCNAGRLESQNGGVEWIPDASRLWQ